MRQSPPRAVAAAALALCLAVPAWAGEARLAVPTEVFRLKNGLTVLVHEDHSAPVVSVNTFYWVGSGREKPGRTGFAHLFEHILFEGSKNVPEGAFDAWLEQAGGRNNGTTDNDRTMYFEDAPSNAVELPMFLESDRMGFLLDAMSPAKVDGQRDVVKNERRQSYENRPYGMAELNLIEMIFPKDHPYSWPTIGSMTDLGAAGYQDVVDFFKTYYGPANASVSIAGDVDTAQVRTLAEKWFGDVPKSEPLEPLVPRPVTLTSEKRRVIEDQVQLPRLYVVWPTPPAFSPAEAPLDTLAGVLANGKNSRLYKRLVYDLKAAQDVAAFQQPGGMASTFVIVVTARAGKDLGSVLKLVDEEIAKLQAEAPAEREVARFRNRTEASFYDGLESVGSFDGKADSLNRYFFYTGIPDYFGADLARYMAVKPADVRAAATRFLGPGRAVLSVVPQGAKQLGVAAAEAGQ